MEQIKDLAKSLKVDDKINWKRTKLIKKYVPKYMRKAVNKHEIAIIGSGDIKNYYDQPLVVIPVNDFMAMLMSCKDVPKRRIRKQGTQIP
jgi:hypothetical protein